MADFFVNVDLEEGEIVELFEKKIILPNCIHQLHDWSEKVANSGNLLALKYLDLEPLNTFRDFYIFLEIRNVATFTGLVHDISELQETLNIITPDDYYFIVSKTSPISVQCFRREPKLEDGIIQDEISIGGKNGMLRHKDKILIRSDFGDSFAPITMTTSQQDKFRIDWSSIDASILLSKKCDFYIPHEFKFSRPLLENSRNVLDLFAFPPKTEMFTMAPSKRLETALITFQEYRDGWTVLKTDSTLQYVYALKKLTVKVSNKMYDNCRVINDNEIHLPFRIHENLIGLSLDLGLVRMSVSQTVGEISVGEMLTIYNNNTVSQAEVAYVGKSHIVVTCPTLKMTEEKKLLLIGNHSAFGFKKSITSTDGYLMNKEMNGLPLKLFINGIVFAEMTRFNLINGYTTYDIRNKKPYNRKSILGKDSKPWDSESVDIWVENLTEPVSINFSIA